MSCLADTAPANSDSNGVLKASMVEHDNTCVGISKACQQTMCQQVWFCARTCKMVLLAGCNDDCIALQLCTSIDDVLMVLSS